MAHIWREEKGKMENRKMKNNKIENNKISPFIAPHSEDAPTKEELDRRSRQYNRLMALGLDPTLIDDTQVGRERENPYAIQAMILINQDKEVPEELIRKIKKYDQKYNQKKRKQAKKSKQKNLN